MTNSNKSNKIGSVSHFLSLSTTHCIDFVRSRRDKSRRMTYKSRLVVNLGLLSNKNTGLTKLISLVEQFQTGPERDKLVTFRTYDP